MRLVARLALALVALVFMAGTMVHAVAATHMTMDMPMAMSSSAGEHMPGCDDCGGDPESSMACFVACAQPALGLGAPAVSFAAMIRTPMQPVMSRAVTGVLQPPDPYPPRPSILN